MPNERALGTSALYWSAAQAQQHVCGNCWPSAFGPYLSLSRGRGSLRQRSSMRCAGKLNEWRLQHHGSVHVVLPLTPTPPTNSLVRLAMFNPRATHADMRLTCGNHAVLKLRSTLHRSSRAALPLARYQHGALVDGRRRDVCTYFEVTVSRLMRGRTGAEEEAAAAAAARAWQSQLARKQGRHRRRHSVGGSECSGGEFSDDYSDDDSDDYSVSSDDDSTSWRSCDDGAASTCDADADADAGADADTPTARFTPRLTSPVGSPKSQHGVFAAEDGAVPRVAAADAADATPDAAAPPRPHPAGRGTAAAPGAGGICIGVSTSAMPLHAMVGSSPHSAGLSCSGHVVADGLWSACPRAAFSYGSTVGVLASWVRGAAAPAMASDAGVPTTLQLTFSVNGCYVATTRIEVAEGVDVFPTVTLMTPGSRAMAHFNGADILYPTPVVGVDSSAKASADIVVVSVDGSVLATPALPEDDAGLA